MTTLALIEKTINNSMASKSDVFQAEKSLLDLHKISKEIKDKNTQNKCEDLWGLLQDKKAK